MESVELGVLSRQQAYTCYTVVAGMATPFLQKVPLPYSDAEILEGRCRHPFDKLCLLPGQYPLGFRFLW